MKTPKVLYYEYSEKDNVETLTFSTKALKDVLYFGLSSGISTHDHTTIRNLLKLQELKYTYNRFGETRVCIDLKEQGLPPYGYR